MNKRLRSAGRAVMIGAALAAVMLFVLPVVMVERAVGPGNDDLGYGILTGLCWAGGIGVLFVGALARAILRSRAKRVEGDQRAGSGRE